MWVQSFGVCENIGEIVLTVEGKWLTAGLSHCHPILRQAALKALLLISPLQFAEHSEHSRSVIEAELSQQCSPPLLGTLCSYFPSIHLATSSKVYCHQVLSLQLYFIILTSQMCDTSAAWSVTWWGNVFSCIGKTKNNGRHRRSSQIKLQFSKMKRIAAPVRWKTDVRPTFWISNASPAHFDLKLNFCNFLLFVFKNNSPRAAAWMAQAVTLNHLILFTLHSMWESKSAACAP